MLITTMTPSLLRAGLKAIPVLVAACSLAVAGCSHDDQAEAESGMVNECYEQVKQRMKDPDSAEFQNIETYWLGDEFYTGGEWNGANSYGAKVGFEPFWCKSWVANDSRRTTLNLNSALAPRPSLDDTAAMVHRDADVQCTSAMDADACLNVFLDMRNRSLDVQKIGASGEAEDAAQNVLDAVELVTLEKCPDDALAPQCADDRRDAYEAYKRLDSALN